MAGALRARRYRRRKNGSDINASVTVASDFDAPGVTAISTPEMCALASRVGDGRASREDLQMAERLIMALVDRLPPDSVFDIGVTNYRADCRGPRPSPVKKVI